VRSANEDRWFADPQRQLFIVADGTGGHSSGGLFCFARAASGCGALSNAGMPIELWWPARPRPAPWRPARQAIE